jgi:signal transduction histidine kinase
VRLTLLYSTLFLLSGAGLLTVTYLLMQHATAGVPGTAAGPLAPAWPAGDVTAAPGPGAIGPSHPDGLTAAQSAAIAHQQAAQATKQRAEQMHQLLVQSGIALGVMSVVSTGLGWIVAGRVLLPLRTITTAARQISATNLHRRLALRGPDDELRELGDTFDELLARLDASFESQRRFVANASHELRTPLARQRTLVQVALSDPDATVSSLRAAHDRVLNATYQQERLIEALLTLARGEQGLDRHQPFDLAEVASRVLLAREAEAAERQVLLVQTPHQARTVGDPHLVERLVANLVDNGLRHNVAPGRLAVATETRDGAAVLVVTNTGPVVPADELDRLFQPFQRLGAARLQQDGGNGLGLSIVRAIATAHGAAVHAHCVPAGGLEIAVVFPADPA